jgi:heat shock protein HtpX
MISALRKIESRGELPGATSAVMELCVDNPREGFGELFDTHPTVENRVAALVKYAGGHDPGPLALPEPGEDEAPAESTGSPAEGPWGTAESGDNAPAQNDQRSSPESPPPAPGPWGPHSG